MQETVLKKVTHLPNGKFNLFSITKMTKQSWHLHGDNKAIWLTKGKSKVVFDINILTNKGMLHAIYFKRNEEVARIEIDTNKKNYEYC